MPQAQITINAVIGSDVDLPINTLVQLNNNNIGGEVSYLWEILDQPTGPADVLSSPTIQNPTFTPKKEGTYLIRLTVNQGLPDEDIDTVVGSVLQLKTRKRVPAAGEQVEASTSRGWALDVNDELRFFHDAAADTGTVVGVNIDASPMAKGTVVRATGSQSIKTGLPGAEDVPGFTPAPATVAGNMDELLLVVEGDIDGSSPVSAGALGVFRYIGQIQSLALGAGAVGDPVYVSDAAVISVTPGTNLRAVGSIMAVNGANRDIWFSGTTGGEGAPTDRAYLVYGSPGTLPNANRVDGLLATGAINNIPYTFKAGDVTTHALVAKRFSAAGGDPFQVHDEAGVVLGKFSASGALIVTPDGTSTTAITGTGSAPNGIGLVGNGTGTGAGVSGIGGSGGGRGVDGVGAGTGAGVKGTASGDSSSSAGVEGFGNVSGAATSSTGVKGTGAGNSGHGMFGLGVGSGQGLRGFGGVTGAGVYGSGGSTSGYGVHGVANGGDFAGVRGEGNGAGTGVEGIGGATGYGVVAEADTSTPIRSALRVVPQDTDPSTALAGDLQVATPTNFLRIYQGAFWSDVGPRVKVTRLSSAQLLNLHSAQVAVTEDPPDGHFLQLVNCLMVILPGTTPYTVPGGADMTVKYVIGPDLTDPLDVGSFLAEPNFPRSREFTMDRNHSLGSISSQDDNPLFVENSGAAYTLGDGEVDVFCWYNILKNPV